MKLLLTTTLLAFAAGGALAATEEDWLRVDADGDGRVSLADMQARHPDTTPEIFRDYDANKDGWLDRKEYLESMPADELGGMINIRPRE